MLHCKYSFCFSEVICCATLFLGKAYKVEKKTIITLKYSEAGVCRGKASFLLLYSVCVCVELCAFIGRYFIRGIEENILALNFMYFWILNLATVFMVIRFIRHLRTGFYGAGLLKNNNFFVGMWILHIEWILEFFFTGTLCISGLFGKFQ